MPKTSANVFSELDAALVETIEQIEGGWKPRARSREAAAKRQAFLVFAQARRAKAVHAQGARIVFASHSYNTGKYLTI